MREFIQDRAVRARGRLFYGIAPGTYYDCFKRASAFLSDLREEEVERGYLTSWGRFVLPGEAKKIAERDAGSTNGCWAPCLIRAGEI